MFEAAMDLIAASARPSCPNAVVVPTGEAICHGDRLSANSKRAPAWRRVSATFVSKEVFAALSVSCVVLAAGRRRTHRSPRRGRRLRRRFADQDRCFAITCADAKGFGAFATRDIHPGELVISEAPVILIEGGSDMVSAHQQYDALPKDLKAAVMGLHDQNAQPEEPKTLEGVIRTNAHQLGSDTADGGLYLQICRFNHSCLPNCEATWNPTRGQLQVYASVRIRCGEELCIPYIDVRCPRSVRRQAIWSRYEFNCSCRACIKVDDESDRRRSLLQELEGQFRFHGSRNPRQGIKLLSDQLGLYDAEGLHLPRQRKMACYFAFQLALKDGQVHEAQAWAERAYKHASVCNGPEHADTLMLLAYARNPRSHPIFKNR